MEDSFNKTAIRAERLLERRKTRQESLKDAQDLDRATKQLIRDINHIAATAEGRNFLRWLQMICGFSLTSITIPQGQAEISMINTLYNEARRNVYIKVREHIRSDLLREYEYNQWPEKASDAADEPSA